MPKPTMGGDGIGSSRAPAILVYFPNEAILASALGPIKLFGFEAEVVKFTAE